MDEDQICYNIDYGWIRPGEVKIIRKRIINTDISSTAISAGLKLVRNDINKTLIDEGAISVRLLNGEWNTLSNKEAFPLGDIPADGEVIVDIRLEIPSRFPEPVRFDVPLLIYYM